MRVAVVGNGRSVHVAARSAATAALGHDVRLVTLGSALPAPGVDVRTRPLPSGPVAAVAAARGFLRDVRSFLPDLLHLHYAGGKLGTMALLSGVRPLVVTVMGGDVLPEQHPGGLSRLERRATRRVLENADLVLIKSEALRSALPRWGAIRARIEVVRWGVDPARFHRDAEGAARLRARFGLDDREAILSPRMLDPRYNIHLIVDALPHVLARRPRACLLLTEYGAVGTYRSRLEGRIAELGVGHNVRFVGQLPHEQMPALLSLADVVVSIPSSDGLPQSLFEAMACETPVILGPLPGYAEAVTHGEQALRVDLEPNEVAAAMLRLLEDRGFARSLADRGLARVREVAFLPREMERVGRLYEEALEAPRSRDSFGARVLDAASLFLR